jgi:succinoglycan biosynthesis protein ExoL
VPHVLTPTHSQETPTSPHDRPVPVQRIIYLAPDCTDSAIKKRVRGFLGLGHTLTCFSFRRDRYNVGRGCDWPNIELGKSEEKRLLARLVTCSRALRTIFRHRGLWREATMVYARNLDLALLALVGQTLTRCRAPLVYEVLDIHPVLARTDLWGLLARWLERRVLGRCSLLVVSSPAYLTHYFQPWQGFRREAFLLENKWAAEGVFDGQRRLAWQPADEPPVWTIGWFGNLRCRKSLEILTQVADALPSRVRIYMRGCASLLGEETLQRVVAGRDNMIFAGEYDAPDELPAIYSQVHFNWCGDFSDGLNSYWLIPNRIYEGGYFGIPALAIEGHETGRITSERQLGIVLQAPYVTCLIDKLQNLDRSEYMRLRGRVESQPASNFVDAGDMARLVHLPAATR